MLSTSVGGRSAAGNNEDGPAAASEHVLDETDEFDVCGAVVLRSDLFVDADTPVKAPTVFSLLSGVTVRSVRTGQQVLSA